MRKYPIGIQDFKEVREGGYLYVDKTRLIHTLIESGKYYFLSRPRRFGKSLLLSTIKEIFSGNKELFKGFWITNNWNWEQRHPVIHLRFSQMAYKELGLADAINRELDMIAKGFGVLLEANNIKEKFRELIQKTAAKGKVVILIDEYDKPVIDYLNDLPKAQENRSVFKSFYSVLKDADEYIRLLLITGVSKFTQVSIFSDLNNLNDITLHPKYTTLAGITQQELEDNFSQEIEEMRQSTPDILQEIKEWYNGYSWFDGKETVYNPFSLLRFMEAGVFQNFWFATGTPTFLVEQIRKRGDFKFEGLRMGDLGLGNFDIERIAPIPLLFQTGYLTIKSYNPRSRTYELDYPNKEVKSSLLEALLSSYREVFPGDSASLTNTLLDSLQSNDIPKVVEVLNTLIATIPYDHWLADKESIFHIIVHLTFKILGVDIDSEVHSSGGRCDAIVQTVSHIYAMEFKLDATAQKALGQILDNGYLQPYKSDKRKKVAIGINFSSEDRKIKDYLVKEL
ncbi:MAG TPA: AAA family ATPase [Puia sp.]|jgi:hypothetical protein